MEQERGDVVVKVEGLSKDYALGKSVVHALRGVSLEIPTQSFTALVGPSGSGKSTLLDLIGCIGRPTSGKVLFDGNEIGRYGDARLSAFRARNIGFVFQTFNLLDVLTAFENVEYPLLLLRTPAAERRKRVAEILERVGLAAYAQHRPAELSGGQRQRVAVARALVASPRVVLADEPTANLDSETGTAILDLIGELNRSLRTTFIIATHDERVMRRATHTFRLNDGRLAQA